jgi:DNA-binding transcriptional ArsR family regulator
MNGSEPVNDPSQPLDLLTIDNLETLRLFTDPLRMRVMSLFADAAGKALTVKQVATQLGLRPTRLYYHINLLEEHGLLRVASSRIVSGILEKSYAAAARSITVDPALLRVSPAGREATAATVSALMRATANEIAEGLELAAANESRDEIRQMRVGKSATHLTPEAHAEFFARLNQLIDDFEKEYGSTEAGPANRALFIAYYPTNEPAAEGTDE